MTPTSRGKPSVLNEPFIFRFEPSQGPVTRKRSFEWQPPRHLSEEEIWHRDVFYPPLYDIPRFVVSDYTPPAIVGTQITVSEGHPHQGIKASGADMGGPFTTTKQYVLGLHGRNVSWRKRNDELPGHAGTFDSHFYYYNGPVYPIDLRGPNGQRNLFPDSARSSSEILNEKGATAVARCKPTRSVANVFSAFGELVKDGVPDIPAILSMREKTSAARKAGHEFLNVEFGWQPLISDFQNFRKAVLTYDAVIKQFIRDSGKVVRRQYTFPSVVTSQEFSMDQYDPQRWFMYPTWAQQPHAARFLKTEWPSSKLVRETTRETWFSGAFTYHVDPGNDTLGSIHKYAQLIQKVSGAMPTPEQIWNLAPWSWAIDWFSNAGDVISNISDQISYGLVMRYGYLMEHSIVRDTYESPSLLLFDDSEFSIHPLTFVTETKTRVKANPFGFGLTWDGLSPLQLAIAAAIGLTR